MRQWAFVGAFFITILGSSEARVPLGGSSSDACRQGVGSVASAAFDQIDRLHQRLDLGFDSWLNHRFGYSRLDRAFQHLLLIRVRGSQWNRDFDESLNEGQETAESVRILNLAEDHIRLRFRHINRYGSLSDIKRIVAQFETPHTGLYFDRIYDRIRIYGIATIIKLIERELAKEEPDFRTIFSILADVRTPGRHIQLAELVQASDPEFYEQLWNKGVIKGFRSSYLNLLPPPTDARPD